MFSNNFYEAYALIVLTKKFKHYDNVFYKKESPDWCSNDVGIEVARAVIEYEQKIFSFAEKNFGKKIEEIGEKKLKKYNAFYDFHEGELSAVALGGLVDTSSYTEPCKTIFKTKLAKLNNNYSVFKNNILFIFSDVFTKDEFINHFIEFAYESQLEKKSKFSYIYVFTREALFCLGLLCKQSNKILLNDNDLIQFKKLAKVYEKNFETLKEQKFSLEELENLLE